MPGDEERTDNDEALIARGQPETFATLTYILNHSELKTKKEAASPIKSS
jgi:hypothetical protein